MLLQASQFGNVVKTGKETYSTEEDSQEPVIAFGQYCSKGLMTAGQAAHNSEHDSLEGEEGSTHLNGTTEGDFTVTLAEMHVTHAQVGALNEDWEVYLSCSTPCSLEQQHVHCWANYNLGKLQSRLLTYGHQSCSSYVTTVVLFSMSLL